MTIYNCSRVKELANEQFRKDLMEHGYDESYEFINDGLTAQEFNNFFILFHAFESDKTDDIFKKWKFYTDDDVYDYIIQGVRELEDMSNYDFDMEELLEEAKSMQEIYGFMSLGDELWIIREEI